MDDDPARQRRSALPWPDPVRRGPGRWTLVASAAIILAIAVGALAVVLARM
jgi:hypothetical protein